MSAADPRAAVTTEIAVVGGGPAGAVVARELAAAGHEVVVFERAPEYRWRACGVFSWTALRQLREVGLSETEIAAVAKPLGRLRLVAHDGSEVALSSDAGAGIDRSALDPLLLERARSAGASICSGTTVTAIEWSRRGGELIVRDGGTERRVLAGCIVGADGIRSVVAASLDLQTSSRMPHRAGLTFHVPMRESAGEGGETVLTVFPGGYCGIAPVPRGRANVGIVLDTAVWARRLSRDGAAATTEAILRGVAARDPAGAAMVGAFEPLDRIEGAVPLAHSVSRVAGGRGADRWLLVGDAAGFLDPFTGEGLGRAFGSALLAAEAVHRRQRGDAAALERYARAYRRRYRDRDRLTLLLQQFVARPALLSYAVRRAAGRPGVRARLEGVLAEALPARRALEPRFLAAILRP